MFVETLLLTSSITCQSSVTQPAPEIGSTGKYPRLDSHKTTRKTLTLNKAKQSKPCHTLWPLPSRMRQRYQPLSSSFSASNPFLTLLLPLLAFHHHCASFVEAIESSPHPYREKQPDGTTTPPLSAKGGPKRHYVTDSKGYTVIEDENHWFVYAEDAADGSGRLSSSGMRVGRGNPEKKGIHQGIAPAGSVQAEQCGRLCDYYDDDGRRRLEGEQTAAAVSSPNTGTLKNLVVLMRFSDHVDRTLPSQADIDVLMNSVGGDPLLAPTGSVRDVYTQGSYGQLTVESTVYDWVTLPRTEHYYADNQNGFSNVFVESLHDALNIIDQDPSFSFTDFDVDGDGTIDAITFLHSGYGAEWSSTDCYGSTNAQRIWSHKWTMPSRLHWYSDDGVRVNKYHISPSVWGTCNSNIGRIGVIAHELGHFLGLPDLYDGTGGEGVGSYDLMGNSWGFRGDQYYPPILSSWSKIQLGWAIPTVLTSGGSYSLSPWATTPDVYRIDEGFPSGEYLLIENRQRMGFDAKMPQSGLTIFHIDDTAPRNDEGYPGQDGWPTNGKHYRVALLQADGNYDLEKGNGRGDDGDAWHSGASIGPSSTNGSAGPYPNTDAYQNGNIVSTGIRISQISSPGEEMTFYLTFDGEEPPAPISTPAPTPPPTHPLGTNELVTTFAGGNGQAGNMLDLRTRKTIDITSLDIHTVSTNTVNVEVWTRPGSYVGHETDSRGWIKVVDTSVLGQGIGNRTPLPLDAFSHPIRVQAGATVAMYVTLTTPDIRYSEHHELGAIFAGNDDLDVFVGIGTKYPWGDVFSPRAFNGALQYQIVEPPDSPTVSPTDMPSDPYWSDFPSMLPTVSPTATPTTANPTPVPSPSPTPPPTIPTSTLDTPLNARTGQAGNQFNVVAGKKDIVLLEMSIHTSSVSSVDAEVWTRPGSYVGHEKNRSDWSRIAKVSVLGRGEGQLTPLPKDSFDPIRIEGGETHAFYVTLTTAEIRYSKGTKQDSSVYVWNDGLSITQGVGVSYPFKNTFQPRNWEGQIKYALQDAPGIDALPTPSPTPVPAVRTLKTTMEGGHGQSGNTLDCVAINDVEILGISHSHTNTLDMVDVEVYTKSGTYRGFERDESSWTLIGTVSVKGSGKGQRTLLPEDLFDTPVTVNAGETQAFYITLTTAQMRYSDGDALGAVYAEDANLKILQGAGVVYPFRATYQPRVWNGGLIYSTTGDE